ncbi:glycosyltransferase family A protein [Methylobacterium nigriterrae]|uniref:glycosyltransferase family A protein n=1 Tax=Methylobacterium nigriterrae TaxID=3127512 RepID=UPI00301386B1
MRDPLPFTFGIALVPRPLARNWALIEALLDLTLTSVGAQTDPDFRVVIACHDRPRTAMDGDPRLSILPADWPVRETGPHNDDSGRKKHALNDHVLAQGGGLFMLVDADDWVDRETVAAARACIGPEEVGGLIEAGMILDLRTRRIAALPHPDIFPGEFHRLCGTSTVACLRPGAADPVRRDPFSTLRSHHQWLEMARERGVRLASLPISACYLINTSENHSDLHGPHLAWRRTLTAAVNAQGCDLDDLLAARFGLDAARVRSLSRRFFPPASDARVTA